jgi:small subunit ribosomal protein S9
MADDERTDETPEEQTPEGQSPEEQTPEGQSPEEQTPEGETPEEQAADEKAAEEQAVEDEPVGDAPAEDQASEEEPAAEASEDAPAPEQPEQPAEGEGGEKPKAKDQPPGAELEPIAIESERELSAEERAKREAEAEERAKREAAATAEETDEEAPRQAAVKLEGDARVIATGKRKTSIARVILLPGSGNVKVNKQELDAYFPRSLHQSMARQPLVATGYDGNVDVQVRVHGGGTSGQAGAVRHGIARALVEVDPELRGELKRRGYLTRDAREKERRKAGLKKARKRPQFSKR